ncbi:HK97 family phage prohead protease [Sphingomonas sp. M1-B02]|uniref:HK97 family phage prohead protease n=1 Tax=Sphingomonas sp. M1-B02 TaxID=3114300 RepID=UPI002240BFF8|nr:HK97 family phage prohead protease [Sphingomonas sp. S6-11]UZK64941.1 HK97 family phage prohead protease [Sphingomonas sp. S6-11]
MSVRFAGYAAVFDAPDRGGDVVRRGAFRLSGTVPLLWQHRGEPVGAIEGLEEDSRGLRVIGRVEAPALAALVAKGAVNGLSFGYRVRQATRGRLREISELQLLEVSLVASPMQPLARVHAVACDLPKEIATMRDERQ